MSVADGILSAKTQQRLALHQPWPHDRANFIVSSCNDQALAAIDAWPGWPGGKLALVGPEGSGKTHLATLWANRADALIVKARSSLAADLPPGRPILVENADQGFNEETLFHLIDRTDADTALLLTARTAPRAWKVQLGDLRSRLNALMVAEIHGPDDKVLGRMLETFFRERNIRPPRSVLDYLVRRIERSASAALAVVSLIDEVAASEGRNITRDLCRDVLDDVQ